MGKWQVNQRKTRRWRERKNEKILIVIEGGGDSHRTGNQSHQWVDFTLKGSQLEFNMNAFSGAIMVKVATFWWENDVIITHPCKSEAACCSPICPCYTNDSYWLNMWTKGHVNKGSGGEVRRSLTVWLCVYVHESLRMCVCMLLCGARWYFGINVRVIMLFVRFFLILPQAQTWDWFLLAVCWDLIFQTL